MKTKSKATVGDNNDATQQAVSLQRNISFISCVSILVGSIIGSGIFISPKGVLLGSGSVGLSLIIWVVCGIMALVGSLVYAELGILMPNSGGNYIYMLEAFDPKRRWVKSYWGSLIPFLFFWQFAFLTRPAAIAVQGMATSQYIIQLASLGSCSLKISEEDSIMFSRLISATFIILVTAMSCHSNNWMTKVIKIFTVAKLVAVFFVIVSGIVMLFHGTNKALHTGFENTTYDGVAGAFYSGTWAYAGWKKLNMVTRELVNPKRDLLRSLSVSCLIVTVIYLLMNVSYFIVLSKESFLASDAVAVDYARCIIGMPGVVFMIVSVTFSIFGSTLSSNMTNNRMAYAAAREGHMVEFFSYIHTEKMIPTIAIVFNGTLALMMVPHSSVLSLIRLTGFVSGAFSFLTIISLLILRKQDKKNKDNFQVPFVFIAINIVVSAAFVVYPLVRDPKLEYIFVVLFMLVGVMVYTLFVYYGKTFPGLRKIGWLVQNVFQVVPPEDDDI